MFGQSGHQRLTENTVGVKFWKVRFLHFYVITTNHSGHSNCDRNANTGLQRFPLARNYDHFWEHKRFTPPTAPPTPTYSNKQQMPHALRA